MIGRVVLNQNLKQAALNYKEALQSQKIKKYKLGSKKVIFYQKIIKSLTIKKKNQS